MNSQSLLIQLFEEAGYHREKQIKLKKLSLVDDLFGFPGPAPGTYRFDGVYNKFTDHKKAYLTTKTQRRLFEFFVDGTVVNIIESLGIYKTVDLSDPNSIDELRELINEH